MLGKSTTAMIINDEAVDTYDSDYTALLMNDIMYIVNDLSTLLY